jgi:hypothetical protein
MPKKPIMGGIVQVKSDQYDAWTGGMPNHDWTGLRHPTIAEEELMLAPNRFRPTSSTNATKLYKERRDGLGVKFSLKSSLQEFLLKVSEHLVNTGMDTIAYVLDPVEEKSMCNVVIDHPRFSVDIVKINITDQLSCYDTYDKVNDKDATYFFLDSLEEDTRIVIRDLCEGQPFPVHVMELIEYVRRATTDHFDKLAEDIKLCKPSQYAGEDLEKMTADMRNKAKELTLAGCYEHRLTLHMLDNFLEAGGRSNEAFRFPLRTLNLTLRAALDKVVLMDKAKANQYMMEHQLTYRDICIAVVRE